MTATDPAGAGQHYWLGDYGRDDLTDWYDRLTEWAEEHGLDVTNPDWSDLL